MQILCYKKSCINLTHFTNANRILVHRFAEFMVVNQMCYDRYVHKFCERFSSRIAVEVYELASC